MDPKLRELEVHIRERYKQIIPLEDAYDAAAAHELYEELRQAGFSKVTVLQNEGSIWVDEAERHDPESLAEADEVFMSWTEEHSLGPAQRLLREEGKHLDLSKDPFGVSREQAQAQVEQALPERSAAPTAEEQEALSGAPLTDTGRDFVTEGAVISEAFTTKGGIPEEEITDASMKSQMVIGIGPMNQEGVHPYLLESVPTQKYPDQTQLVAHDPKGPGGARLVESYNTSEVNALVENVSFDIRADIDRMDQSQKLVQQEAALKQLANTSPETPSLS